MSALYSIGATNQLADALENAGFTPGDLTKLTQFKDLDGIKAVLNGKALIIYPENFIDCDSDPFVFEDWEVEEHKKGGMFKFNPEKISLYLSKQQKKGSIGGHDLRKYLADKPVMNANVLDYLLAHPKLIPKEWKGKYIFFLGHDLSLLRSPPLCSLPLLGWFRVLLSLPLVRQRLQFWWPGCARKLSLDLSSLVF